ncbi:MAG: serine/threonine-protein phosphatase [Treponema sp.]|jgi:hypothetical protein|nr:serine/threonine-protein phosphatase [Treponema sp.]
MRKIDAEGTGRFSCLEAGATKGREMTGTAELRGQVRNLCTDVGFVNLNKYGEQLCGDHVECAGNGGLTAVVLADGMGSGVKASILSTLTAKIIATMMANNLSVEDCVTTIAATLPVCKERQIAYSTFTIIRITGNLEAEIIQYDNPLVILLRGGKNFDYPRIAESMGDASAAGRGIIYKSKITLHEDDTFIALSDGAVHAGTGRNLNFGWRREDIIAWLEGIYRRDFTAKTLSALLLDKCFDLYGGRPGDDTTVCTVKIRERRSINLLTGPPANPEAVPKMMTLFFSKEGRHIVCGGTTSTLAAEFLHKPLVTTVPAHIDPAVPPTAAIEGVDLVTEGVITIGRVLEYARDYMKDNEHYVRWHTGEDGASRIARVLFEEATDINFYVGRAVNPAHQNPGLPIGFGIKMNLINELAGCLKQMGKQIKVSYF